MLPDDTLIQLDEASFLPPRNKPFSETKSYELGGIAIGDTSEPFEYNWQGYVEQQAIYLQRFGGSPVTVLAFEGEVTEMSFTFDQNMRPTIAFVEDGVAKLYWYDASLAKMVITNYPNIKNPRVCLDDKRKFNVGGSDIIFAFVADSSRLCYRLQRERYGLEHELMIDELSSFAKPLELERIGMSTQNRFIFETK